MNTITTTASTDAYILAIDLGKYKSVACVLDHATGEFRFTTFDTTPAFNLQAGSPPSSLRHRHLGAEVKKNLHRSRAGGVLSLDSEAL
jgi:hypothetical protein